MDTGLGALRQAQGSELSMMELLANNDTDIAQ